MLNFGPASSSGGRMRLPLLAKMLLLLLPVVVVPLIILGVMSIRRGTDAIGQTAQQTLQVIASTAGARLDQELLEAQKLQVVVATTETVVKACSAPASKRKDLLPGVEQWLKEVLSADPDLELAYLADDQGVCIVSTSPNMVGRDYKKTREYMRRALEGENNISDLAMGITTREPGIFVAGPVRDRNNRIAGAVVLKLRGRIIDRVSHDVSRQTDQGYAVVIDANGIIISHPNPKGLYHSVGTLSPDVLKQIDPKLQYGVDRIESSGQEDLANALRDGHGRGNLMFIGIDGLPKVAGYMRMTQRPWTVAVVQPRSQFDQPMSNLASAQKWWIAVMALLAACGAAWITYSLLRPIRALSAAATKAAEGDWSARAAVYSNDELGDLAKTFNAMMPALQERSRIEEDLHLANEVQRKTQEHADQLLIQKEALTVAEERVRQILESTAEGIFGVDTEGRITFVNPAVSRMLGFTAEEMIGQSSHQLIHHHRKDGREYTKEECPMYAAYTHGKASRIDDEFLWRKDGSGMPAEYGATPIRKDGKVVGAVISFLNVTLRKQAEEALQKRKDELQHVNFLSDSALDLTKAGYWHVPLDGSGWYNSSERAARIFGDHPAPDHHYTLQHWMEHVKMGDETAAEATAANFEAAVKGDVPVYDATYAYKRPVDGRVVWIHALGHVVKDEHGQPRDMFGVTQDITEFKLAEQALAASERKIRRILESTEEGFWLIDNTTATVEVNNAMCKILGRPREEVIGRSILDFTDEENARIFKENVARRARGESGSYEVSLSRPDKTLVPCQVNATPLLDDQGIKIGSFAMFTDITERKKMEIELTERLAELERFNRLVIGREERMIQLKEEINGLMEKLGQEEKYKIPE